MTLAFAFPRLSPGNVLCLRGGIYFERNLNVSAGGTLAAPITLASYPGETPIIDGGYREFRAMGNTDWEVVDASRAIYRSVRTFGNPAGLGGYFGAANHHYKLISYNSLAILSSDSEDYNETPAAYYAGPGVFWNSTDQRIYIRMQRSTYAAALGVNVPVNSDPRQTELYIFADGRVLNFSGTARYLNFVGIHVVHADRALEFQTGSHDITFQNGVIRGGQYFVLVRNDAYQLIFDQIIFPNAYPPYVDRNCVKFPENQSANRLPVCKKWQSSAIQIEGGHHIQVSRSLFQGMFDAIDAPGTSPFLKIHDNVFEGIMDDTMEVGSGSYQVEFLRNKITKAFGGFSWDGGDTGGSPPADQRGTKFVGYNIVDTSVPVFCQRNDPLNLVPNKYSGPSGNGYCSSNAFGRHEMGGITGPDPFIIYQNTIVLGQDLDHETGLAYPVAFVDPSHPHEIYNNILVQTDNQWINRGARVDDCSQIMDGNLYHRPGSNFSDPLFYQFRNGSSTLSFSTLTQLKNNSNFMNASRTCYAPGWEASGVEGNPELDATYRPSSTSPALSGAVNLSGRNFPGYRGGMYRGAVSP